jgi:glycerol-3-phosphate acyltransferase PlsY
MSLEFVLLCVAAYLLGSVPAAYLAVKWSRGIDIRQYGTGKVGASNVMKLTSRWLALPVAIFDIGKGALMVWAAQLLGLNAAAQVTVGIITIIGHNWPIFLNFKGGRGVFTSLGVITMLSPWLGLIIFVMPYTLAPIRQVALGVFFALTSLPIFSWFLSQPLGIEDRLPITLGFVVLSLIGLFRRLVTTRTELSESVPAVELFINRLLFDRDIRDRKAWTERNPQNSR